MNASQLDHSSHDTRTSINDPWDALGDALLGWGKMLGLVVVAAISAAILGDIMGFVCIVACLIGDIVFSISTARSHLQGLRLFGKEVMSDSCSTSSFFMCIFHCVGLVLLSLGAPISLIVVAI